MSRSSFVIRATLPVMIAGITACGVTYHSPTVQSQAEGMAVTIANLTPDAVQEANRSPYKPLKLPKAFFQIASSNLSSARTGSEASLPTLPKVPAKSSITVKTRLPPASTAQAYRIGVGDVLRLATKSMTASDLISINAMPGAPMQKHGYTVRDDGMLSIPDIGTVSLRGKTLQQAEDAVFQAFVAKNIEPSFSLEVSEYNSQYVTIGGAVKSGGRVPVTIKPLELAEAVAAVGQITVKDESFAVISLFRDGILYEMPASALREDKKARSLRLIHGDAIFVDQSFDPERAMAFYRTQIEAVGLKRAAQNDQLQKLESQLNAQRARLEAVRRNFEARTALNAENRHLVYLAGEVKLQGAVALPYDRKASLAEVLYKNGGFSTTTGDPRRIYLLRTKFEGEETPKVTAWKLDAGNVLKMALATQMEMRPNDIIFIEEQAITKWSRAFEQAFPILVNKAVSDNSP